MTSIVLLSSSNEAAEGITEDLAAVGFKVSGLCDCTNMLQRVISLSPDMIVGVIPTPDTALFDSLATLARTEPRPVALFTTDPDAEKMGLALRSGVHAYVVAGYGRTRIRAVVHLAQARFRQEQTLQRELADLRTRFDERKLVDRAKGILMGARQLREDEAFRALRNAAMASKQRIGQISHIVIQSAHYAEAINRAGQLRMLSQRLVKLYALACLEITPAATKSLFNGTIEQVDVILAILSSSLSQPTYGDLLGAVARPWGALKALIQQPRAVERLRAVDALAEELLDHAERLTTNLEIAAYAPALRTINVAGRQRMLSQRLAKEALLGQLWPERGPLRAGETQTELMQGLQYLAALPLTNAEIAREFDRTMAVWGAFQQALKAVATPVGQETIADTSEALLEHFDRLTHLIERGIQSLIGLI